MSRFKDSDEMIDEKKCESFALCNLLRRVVTVVIKEEREGKIR